MQRSAGIHELEGSTHQGLPSARHVLGPDRACTDCGASATAVAASPGCSALARAIFQRPKILQTVDVGELFGFPAAASASIVMQLLTVGQNQKVLDAAYKARAEHAKLSGEGREAALKDDDALFNDRTIETLFMACWTADATAPAFPSAQWMREHITADQIAALLNVYEEMKRRQTKFRVDGSDAEIETISRVLAEHAEGEMPESILAPYPRWFLTHLAVRLSILLERERRRAELAEQRADAADANVAALEGELGSCPASAAPTPPRRGARKGGN